MNALGLARRELARRRLRSTLTAAGIAIGVAALVLLGGLAERLGSLVGGGRDFARGQISISGAGASALSGMTRGGLVTGEQLAALGKVEGVSAVAPIVMFPVGDATASVPFGMPPLVFGVDAEALFANGRQRNVPPPPLAAGRLTPTPDTDEIVVGSQIARRFGLQVGGRLPVRGREFTVVGVLAPTLTGPDSFVFMPFGSAERLLLESEPVLRKLALVPGSTTLPIATAAAVFWGDGDAEVVADRIRHDLPQLAVVSPADAAQQIDRALSVLTGIITAAALAALLVAALAVTNTMFTAVLERRQAIGLLRAVGATRGQVLRQLMTEAMLLGLLGAVAGLSGGAAVTTAINRHLADSSGAGFLLTPRLVCGALFMPPLLAMLGGWWPARRAARLAPTEALRNI